MKANEISVQGLIDHIKTAIDDIDPRAKEMVEEMLKRHESIIPYIDVDEAKCPDCKVRLTRQELLGDDVLFEDFFDYCPKCGKPVNWEELFNKEENG